MRRVLAGVVGATLLAGLAPAVAGVVPPDDALHTYRVGSAYARVAADHVDIGDDEVSRTWSIAGGSVETTSLTGPDGTEWATTGPDFTIDLGGVTTTSTSGWTLSYVQAFAQRDRVEVEFRFNPVDPALPTGVTLSRDITLAPGES
ncbi:MAG TPA: hypothetical protein VHE57_02950, partial [Mycobacteriales bacterium]|nr:hypothetical protein [Mycobacteriales bacterium]